jgi:hypothetical protein
VSFMSDLEWSAMGERHTGPAARYASKGFCHMDHMWRGFGWST